MPKILTYILFRFRLNTGQYLQFCHVKSHFLHKIMLFDGRLDETVKHTHKGTSFAKQFETVHNDTVTPITLQNPHCLCALYFTNFVTLATLQK